MGVGGSRLFSGCFCLLLLVFAAKSRALLLKIQFTFFRDEVFNSIDWQLVKATTSIIFAAGLQKRVAFRFSGHNKSKRVTGGRYNIDFEQS